MELLLASANRKKLAELERMLAPLGIGLLTPADVGGLAAVEEDRATFAENARKKSTAAALATGRWCLADDSGLEVEALGGEPGARSARFPGEPFDHAANNALLLQKLAGVPESRRGARFVCALSLSRPDGSSAAVLEGTAAGRILFAPRGDGDFGYDPLFQFAEDGLAQTGRTFAELRPEEKAAVSHRGRALRLLLARLPEILRGAE